MGDQPAAVTETLLDTGTIKVERHKGGCETVTFTIDDQTFFRIDHLGNMIEIFGSGDDYFTMIPRASNVLVLAYTLPDLNRRCEEDGE